jgi:hypothetical protein
MYTHVSRSQTRSLLGCKRYVLAVRLYVTQLERDVVDRHRLERIELFHDPRREQFDADAMAAHANAKSHGLFVTKARDSTTICISEISALVSSIRALLAFRITVADLLRGVTIQHRSLQAIRDIEEVLTACIDSIDRSVQAALSYSDQSEDIFAPGPDTDTTIAPNAWVRAWRH